MQQPSSKTIQLLANSTLSCALSESEGSGSGELLLGEEELCKKCGIAFDAASELKAPISCQDQKGLDDKSIARDFTLVLHFPGAYAGVYAR